MCTPRPHPSTGSLLPTEQVGLMQSEAITLPPRSSSRLPVAVLWAPNWQPISVSQSVNNTIICSTSQEPLLAGTGSRRLIYSVYYLGPSAESTLALMINIVRVNTGRGHAEVAAPPLLAL